MKSKLTFKKLSAVMQTAVFLLFLFGLGLLHAALPDREFSERENRSLQTLPRFSLSALTSGRLTSNLESYANDQFPFRDGWITLKAGTELAIGKKENNGIYLCPGDVLLEGFSAPETGELDKRIGYVNALADSMELPLYFALVPSAGEIWRDLLPDGAPNDSQKAVTDYIYARVHAGTADICGALEAHREEPLFYRTDHHWTTLGAWYGYAALGESMGYTPIPLDAYSPHTVTEKFYGTAWSGAGFSWVPPDSITVYVAPGGEEIINYPQGTPTAGLLYDEANRDKYAYFFGGNTPLLTVRTGNPGPRLLILRDSYMDSLSPFLFPHFSELHLMDLRYYNASVKKYLEDNDIEAVLLCYNVKNFGEDNYLFLAAH